MKTKPWNNLFLLILFLISCLKANAVNYNMSTTSITVCSGNFYDSNGSGSNYSANENYTMTINPGTAGQFVNVSFSAFSTEVQTDYLYIYDGPNTSSTLIGMYSGTTSPVNITAVNSAGCLTFKFTSNGNTHSSGWAASISCSATAGSSTGVYPMTSGAAVTATAGTFYDSGGSGNNYANSENKTMTFYPGTAGQYVNFKFTAFATDYDNDLLYIYDGSTTSAPLMAIYSGSTSPDTIAARNSAGSLTFVFVSNGNTVTTGWSATFNCSSTRGSSSANYPMTNSATDTVNGGRFYDHGGSGSNYTNNESAVMTFYPATSGQYINVSFSTFATRTFTDILYIYDGPGITSTLIGIYSGSTSPVSITALNSAGCLTFKFTSNNATQTTGWAATLSCTSTSTGSTTGAYFMTNGAAATADGGTFYDSGGGSNYDNSESKISTFYPATTGQFVNMNFSSFSIDQFSDFLYIYDGASTSSTLLGIYSGTTSPGNIRAMNASGCLTFKFTSNGNTVSTGWIATITSASTAGSSTGVYLMTNSATVTAASGTFYDSGGGSNYEASESKTTTFYPSTSGQYLSFIFSTFATDQDNDYFSIYDGATVSSPLIATYSGSVSPDTIVARNSQGCLTFVFTSNGNTQTTGWVSAFTSSSVKGTSSGTYPITNGAVDTLSGGRFYDAGGASGNYNANENETMTFYPATAGQYLCVNFSAFATDQATDLLYIYDGTSVTAPLLGIFSGSASPCTFNATNSTGALTFKFTSNGNTQTTGWAATFSLVTSSCSNAGCYPVTNSAVVHTCGGTFTDSGGSSGSYSSNESNTMTLYPTSGMYVQLTFSAFSTQASTDILYVYDGSSTSATLIGTYSGTTIPSAITATNSAGTLTTRFTSNGNTQSTGWVATVTCTGTANATTWSGLTSSDWTAVSNWTNNCTTPACGVDVTVASGGEGPVIASNTTVNNLTINSGAVLTINAGVTVTLCGNFVNNGTINVSPTATLLFNNGSATQTLSGTLTGVSKIGNLTITKTGGSLILGNDIEISGTLTTTNSTSILNTAGYKITLGGNFTNSSGSTTFTNPGSTGILEFNGTGAQTYSAGGTLNLNHVIVNTTGSGITLSGNNMSLGTTGVMTLTAGKIITGSLEVTLQNTSASAINSGSSTSYIQGTLSRYLAGTATSYDFPVGHTTYGYQLMKVTFTTTTTIPILTAVFKTWSTVPNGPSALDCDTRNFGLLPALNNGYWEVTPSANPTSGTYDLTLNNLNYTNLASADRWTIMKATTNAGPWSLTGTCVTSSTAAVTRRTGLSGFGVFGTGQGPNALPVELSEFSGYSLDDKNILAWETVSEKNNNYFTLEKSSNSNSFFEVIRIAGAGNSNQKINYLYADDDNHKANTYYRLKQTDFDGRFKYSKTIVIESQTSSSSFEISPNPNKGLFIFKYTGTDDHELSLKISDTYGKTILTSLYEVKDGILKEPVNMGNVPNGIYFVQIFSGLKKVYVRKILVNY